MVSQLRFRSFTSNRRIWLRYIGYLTFLITTIQAYLFLSKHPEASLVRMTLNRFRHPQVLRPGQYQQIVNIPSVKETADEDSPDSDKMGMAHDRR